MTPFGFSTATAISVGRGVAAHAAPAAARHGRRVLVIHGSRPAVADGLIAELAARGVATTTLACTQEPTLGQVEAATDLARTHAIEAVVGIGGGSVIDLAKAVAALAPGSGPVLDHLEVVGRGLPLQGAPLPCIVVPTTAGTGAEVTRNAVIGLPDHRRKVSLRGPQLLPALALVDPALTDGAPPGVTLGSGLDAVTQVIEAFVSCKATPLTDALCRDALPGGLAAIRALAQAESPQARDTMAYTSLVGGLALANAGLGAVHGLAGPIGGGTGAPHGEICAALLPHVLAENARLAEAGSVAAAKLAFVLEALAHAFGTSTTGAPNALDGWMRAAGLRALPALGVRADDIGTLARQAVDSSSSRGNPVTVDEGYFRRVLERASGG